MIHVTRARRRGESGAAAVEFALVLPFLLLLLFGLIQYGLYFWAIQGGSNAAREGARRAAVGSPAACADFQTYVKNRMGTIGDPSTAAITRTYKDGTTDAAKTASTVVVGDVVTVTVRFQSIDMHLPLLPFPSNGIVTQRAEARVEYVPTTPVACS
ncbi:MAG: hypothetical protein HOQ22_17915 [Nocardioidaceae bacterium]|nr:hypothetical protein [Nocardioidaceae bacterium]